METFSPLLSDGTALPECSFQTVSRVIDGDTFEISDGTKVRLLGVDTPEILDPRKDVQWFGKESSLKLRKWIEGETVCLRPDTDKTQDIDKYGRLLRYAWKFTNEEKPSANTKISTGFFVNAEIIKQGYGFAYTKYPFQYLEDFRKYEKSARKNNRGLWNSKRQDQWKKEFDKNRYFAGTCGKTGTICPEDALNHIGEYKTVRFFVKKSYDSGKAVFLNSKNNFEDHDNFTAVLFSADRNEFPPQPAYLYLGKTIDVSGRIKEYEGRAEIILKDMSQIKINPLFPSVD
jgi:micrococcal nuclease